MTETTYTVGSNVPGYLPEEDDPPTFDNLTDAVACLRADLIEQADAYADAYGVESDLVGAHLQAYDLADAEAMADTQKYGGWEVRVPTSDSAHDLGRVYWVSETS